MGRIESYYIRYNDEVTNEERFKMFYDLYHKILNKDDKWHYFTEGTYDELRFHSKYKRKVEKFLEEDNNIVENYAPKDGGWEDDHDTVEEYKEYFTEIFHQNAVVAMSFYDKREEIKNLNYQKFIDRVVHSFFNMQGLLHKTGFIEERVMADYLIDRAFYTGMQYAYNKMKETNDDE